MPIMKKQHFHHAAITGFFWGNKKGRRSDVLNLKISNFLSDRFYSMEHPNIENYIRTKKTKNIMASYMIFEETEKNIKVGLIEDNFYKLAKELSYKQDEDASFIEQYICYEGSKEYDIILNYFILQYSRNPNSYPDYLDEGFLRNGNSDYMTNTQAIDAIKIETLKKINLIIEDTFIESQKKFRNYSFKIFENKNNNNFLIDTTIIKLNEDEYFIKMYKENFYNTINIFNNIFILTINSRFSLLFYPSDLEAEKENLIKIYKKHQIFINIINARQIIFIPENKEYIILEIEKMIDFFNINKLKYFVERNEFINQIEHKIKSLRGINDF